MNMEIGCHFLVYCVWFHGKAKTIVAMMRFKVCGSDADDCHQILPHAYETCHFYTAVLFSQMIITK